ncbi:29 kDa ribonucleoprotein B [Durusdinium trenchii]|uniref:Chloroplastic (CP29B) n=1 Tax=Durusdinium trenchii TaxID=1381693 RepID=A0ABP0QBG7_9DINO
MALPLPPLFKPKLLLSPVVMQVARFLGVGARTIETRVRLAALDALKAIAGEGLDSSESQALHLVLDEDDVVRDAAAEILEHLDLTEVARLDITFASTDRLVLVTFYDVRVAQQVLSDLKPNAWPAQEGMNDLRAVRLSSSEFAALPRHERGFERFGEIAGLSNCVGDLVIEFYDMRAALRCTFDIPGSEPNKCGPMCHWTGGSAKGTGKTSGGSSPSPPMWTVRSPPGLTRSDAANNDRGIAFLLHADRRGCYPEFKAPRKIFVGSLPDGIEADVVKAEFSRYGLVEEMFLKQGCESGRQWGFVTFATAEEAQFAQEQTNGILMFETSLRPCEVIFARNQGLYGSGSLTKTAQPSPSSVLPIDTGPKKIFVGTLPDNVSENVLLEEFSKYGEVRNVFLKPNCDPGRHWGFITFATSQQAMDAKASCDRTLMLPGAERPCEVTIAKHQGMYGQDADGDGGRLATSTSSRSSYTPLSSQVARPTSTVGASYGGSQGSARPVIGASGHSPIGLAPANGSSSSQYGQDLRQTTTSVGGPCKVFVGSLPDGCPEHLLRQEFSRYGQITDVFMKQGCEPGRQWAFIIFSSAEEAMLAKESTDKILQLPGASRACEVMLAKNQGMYGQAPLRAFGLGPGMQGLPGQPPPPTTPPPPHLTPWRTYKTQSGLPYYHNSQTGQTVWECPTEFEPPPGNVGVGSVPANGRSSGRPGARYAPY